MSLPYNADVAAVAPRESSGERMTEVMEKRKVRIVLVDDHAVVRAGFKQLIETTDDLEVAGEAGTAADALAFVASQPCDVMLLDISLPDASVLDTVAALRHRQLSNREFQIFVQLAAGKTVTDIADEMCLSVKTISTYRSRIFEKMDFSRNADLTAYALRHNLMN